MTRRTLWAALHLAPVILAAHAADGAAAAGKVHRLGVLALAPPAFAAPYIEATRQDLRALGYIEGQNLAVDFRFAASRDELLPQLAAELVRLQPDVIVAVGDRAVQAIKVATSTIPLVFVSAGDPVRSGFVASLARPGGNVTGLSSLLPELNAKELSLLKEAVPKALRVAVLWNPRSHGGELGFKEMQAAAPSIRVTLQSREVLTPDELEPAFAAMASEQAGGLVVLTDPLTFRNRNRVIELAARGRIPSIFEVREFVDAGGLMSYGPSLIGMIRRSSVYIDKILKGTKPADLPVEQPTRFELVINMKTAKALGLTIPPSVLIRADQVIQ